MKMRNYLKKENEKVNVVATINEIVYPFLQKRISILRKLAVFVICAILTVPLFMLFTYTKEIKTVDVSESSIAQVVTMPVAATVSKKTTITVPSGTIKANPFLPYREISGAEYSVADVPAYNLVEPPEVSGASSDAIRVMDTIVSGILYDKFNPSAILNIEGNDYLVKKGDVVNNYKVLNIAQDSVTVQLGANVYKAGIGEILTEGSLHHNDVSNLSNKFGGVK